MEATAAEQASGATIAGRLAELCAEIGRLAEAVAQLGLSEALRQRLAAAESELASLTAAAAPRVKLDPDRAAQQALVAYKRRLLDLGAALQQETMDRERTRALLADILRPAIRKGSGQKWKSPLNGLRWRALRFFTMVARARNVRRKLIRPSNN